MTNEIKKQFDELKAKRPDALLLFRCGDFYETYEEDAVAASEILGITLTKRSDDGTKMAGFPHHALDSYLPRLIRAGKRVAICDQLTDPTTKLAQRGITELVSPGLAQEPVASEPDELPIADPVETEAAEPQDEHEPVSFAIDTAELADALKLLERVVPRNPVLPVTTTYKMELSDNLLTITATDTDIWLSCRIIATGETCRATFLLPAAGLAKLIAGLRGNDELDVEVNASSLILRHSAGSVTIDKADYPVTDFPSVPETQPVTRSLFGQGLTWAALRDWLGTMAAYTAYDDLRPALNGVHLECSAERTDIVATDGRMLCLRSYPGTLPEGLSLTVHTAACRVIAAMPDEEPVLSVSPDGWLSLVTDSTAMHVRTDGLRYPNYRSVIPVLDDYSTAVLPRDPFTAALQRVVGTRSESQCANTRIRPGRVEIRETGCTSGMTEAVNADCQVECSLGINAQFALNLIRLTDGDTVTMYYKAANKPVLWATGELTLLQMPMRFDESLYDNK